jgi:hypothetical protein
MLQEILGLLHGEHACMLECAHPTGFTVPKEEESMKKNVTAFVVIALLSLVPCVFAQDVPEAPAVAGASSCATQLTPATAPGTTVAPAQEALPLELILSPNPASLPSRSGSPVFLAGCAMYCRTFCDGCCAILGGGSCACC